MGSIVWTSHRGLHKKYVENTREAFAAAVNAGFTSLETDLRLSSDGHIVLHHDPSMERTAGQSLEIRNLTLKQFQETGFIGGQKGMSLQDLFDDFSKFRWIFDVKPEMGSQTLEALKSWAEKNKAEGWILGQVRFLLWSSRDEIYLQELFPGAVSLAREPECQRAGFSVLLGLPFLSGIKAGRAYAVPPRFWGLGLFTRRIINSYKARGAKVIGYLPESKEELDLAIQMGVDEILTNGEPQ